MEIKFSHFDQTLSFVGGDGGGAVVGRRCQFLQTKVQSFILKFISSVCLS